MATRGARLPIFLDTNMLVYANVQTAPLHRETLAATQEMHSQGTELWISRQVLREYIATVTREQTFMSPMPAKTVVERVRYFESRFRVAEDNAQVTARLLALLETIPLGGKQVHDANIVATMQAYGISRLLTHNTADFRRFSALITVLSLDDVKHEPGTEGTR